jgi:hypothetical protein
VISLSIRGLVVDIMNNLAFPQRHEAEYEPMDKIRRPRDAAGYECVTPVMAAAVGQFSTREVWSCYEAGMRAAGDMSAGGSSWRWQWCCAGDGVQGFPRVAREACSSLGFCSSMKSSR